MKTSLGGIDTHTHISYNDDGSVKEMINLITQHQLTSLKHSKHQEYWRCVGPTADDAELPVGPWMASKIRNTRVIRDTHVNTNLAGTDDCQTGTDPGKPGPVTVFRQSNSPGPGPVL